MTNNVFSIQERLKLGLDISLYNEEEIKYMITPMGKAMYNGARLNKKEDVQKIVKTEDKQLGNENILLTESEARLTKFVRMQKVICDTCGQTYTRANRHSHIKTKVHKAYDGMNNKLRKILLEK